MTPLHDYVYRFAHSQLHMAGRCRVRIYERKNSAHTVLLTELHDNPGESIASSCERIATELAARWQLNPRTTRWIQHVATLDNQPQHFETLEFTWDSQRIATAPRWQRISEEKAADLTGAALSAIARRIGDSGA